MRDLGFTKEELDRMTTDLVMAANGVFRWKEGETCSHCQQAVGVGPSWRINAGWEHACPAMDPQVGHTRYREEG